MSDDPSTAIYRAIWDDYLFSKGSSLLSIIKPGNRFNRIDRMVEPPDRPITSDLPSLKMEQLDFWADTMAGNATSNFQEIFEILIEVDLDWGLVRINDLKWKVMKELWKGKPSFGLDFVTSWSATAGFKFQNLPEAEGGGIYRKGFTIRLTVNYWEPDNTITGA